MGEGVLDGNISITFALAYDFTFELCFGRNTRRIHTTQALETNRAYRATPSCFLKPANNFLKERIDSYF